MFRKFWGFITRLEVAMALMIVLMGVAIWGGFQPAVFETRGVPLLLGFLAFTLSAYTIEKVRQLFIGEVTFQKFGAILSHFSVVLLLIGGLYGKLGGYVLQVPIIEGQAFHEPRSHFDLLVKKFIVEMDDKHRPIQFRSILSVWDKETPVRTARTEMNHPMIHRGVKIYQAAYGIAQVDLRVENGGHLVGQPTLNLTLDGNVVRKSMVYPLRQQGEVLIFDKVTPDFGLDSQGKPVQVSTLPANPAVLVFYNRHFQAKPLDAELVGWVSRDHPGQIGPYHIYMKGSKVFTGLQFRKDPGLPFFYAGFVLVIVGILFMFYFPSGSQTGTGS